MKDEIKDTIENQLDKTETNDETKSIETERKINDLIFEQNLKVMKKEELIKKLDNLIKSNNEINYNEEMTSEELENTNSIQVLGYTAAADTDSRRCGFLRYRIDPATWERKNYSL